MKQPSSVRGFKINCINYEFCPFCFGCRNYNDNDPECLECVKNKKFNICNVEKHKPELISKMILRNTLEIKNDKIEFKEETNEDKR